MKKVVLVLGMLLGMSLLLTTPAQAVYIVDTGQPSVGVGHVLDSSQWLAAEFTLTQNYTLTDIQGFMYTANTPGTAGVAIYSDGGDVPGTEIYSDAFYIYAGESWQGLSGLTWNLEANTYWVSFEVRPEHTFYGSMADGSPPSPLGNEAIKSTYNNGPGVWVGDDNLDLGIRIQGSVIPEPSSMLLLGSGIVSMAAALRRRKGSKKV
ncbi:MAG: PEP-CTERM sorting domain-containing protein [Nitrospirae bacterium]|nr:PEP-CTERM sorting domain-containing protein [Nitrospirota bacterium]